MRDIDCDAAAGDTSAVQRAERDVAAGNGYALYVHTVQNLLASHVRVEVWAGAAASEAIDGGWVGSGVFDLDCPTGLLVVGDEISASLDGIDPSEGPGRYRVAVYHRGRDEARSAHHEAVRAIAPGLNQALSEVQSRHRGVERYLLRLWWQQPLPGTEGDDD
ncbi:hypothetical protein F6X54_26740 [Micromonospora aurantiaca]|uniref:Uncharacterized protein n=1 Tax=Micromonospora aurantiaca (nom. illeg.) TaxID=47850 RepID=A0ABQ6U9Q4_9ACTN|nr:hypothetical protein [Micromonospora aurantiaca]KAB1107441.1 hypothetical protein F6X54_26740 [Micromonospora aurantiaca]